MNSKGQVVGSWAAFSENGSKSHQDQVNLETGKSIIPAVRECTSEPAELRDQHNKENIRPLRISKTDIQCAKLEKFEKIAHWLRTELSTFIKNDAVRPNGIGFHVVPQAGLKISGLKKSLAKAGDRLESLFIEDSVNDPISINVRSMATNLQLAVDSSRVELFRQLRSDDLGAGESVLALRMMMQLRQNVAAALQEAALYKHDL